MTYIHTCISNAPAHTNTHTHTLPGMDATHYVTSATGKAYSHHPTDVQLAGGISSPIVVRAAYK